MVTDETGRVKEFEEKPEKPSSNLASMGIYIFSWPVLKEALIALKAQSNCDFGKHILPYCKDKGQRLFAYEYSGYWKDVGTLGSYCFCKKFLEAHMVDNFYHTIFFSAKYIQVR